MNQQVPLLAKEYSKIALQEAVKKCILNTPPFPSGNKTGGQSEGIKSGLESLEHDVKKVFKPVETLSFKQVLATQDWNAIAAYNFKFRNPELKKALDGRNYNALEAAFKLKAAAVIEKAQFVDVPTQSLHQSQRGTDGRVISGNKVFYVKQQAAILDYIRRGMDSVGKMIGGWYIALRGLGVGVVSPYPAQGSGGADIVNTGGIGFTVSAYNDLGNFNGMLTANMDVQAAVDAAAQEVVDKINIYKAANPAPNSTNAPAVPQVPAKTGSKP